MPDTQPTERHDATAATPAGPLTTAAMASLKAFYAASNNHPSQEHLAALEAVAQTMEAMARGTCPPSVHLAALDPGIGKSQTAIHFARALVSSAAHRGAGMVICLGRLSQVRDMAKALSLPQGSLAVLTSDPACNALSTATVNEAQMLLTTQQLIERRTHGSRFADTAAFYYRDAPRAIRVWDEAIEFGAPITLLWSDIAGLSRTAMSISPKFATALFDFAGTVRGLGMGAEIAVPDFEVDHGITWRDVEAGLAGGDGSSREMQATRDLRALNGNVARAYLENERGAVALSYEQRIPDDIRPILVLDASIRVRQTYLDMETHRRGFVRLPDAVKDYADLRLHIWQTSGAKSAFAKRGAEIVQGVTNTILTKPDQTWLVVTHKAGARVKDVQASVLAGIPVNVRPRVAFLTFGNHMATNDHADAENVILAGQFFAPLSLYAAMTHAAQGRPVTDGLVSSAEVEATKRGELADVTLQAVCRGRCRKSAGSKAMAMDAYIIATAKSGIPAAVSSIFPGCQVVKWEPFRKELKGNVKLSVQYVAQALAAGREAVPYAEIREALNIAQGNFSKHVTATDDWRNAVVGLGCEIHRGARGALSVRVVA